MPDHLKKRGNVYWLKLPIPQRFQHLYPTKTGKHRTHHEVSLRTSDLAEANERKHLRITLHLQDRKRRLKIAAVPGELPAHLREAMKLREGLQGLNEFSDPDDLSDYDIHTGFAADRAQEIERTNGETAAQEFYRLATKKEPTIREAWSQWMSENEHNAGTKLKDEQALREFLGFLKLPDTFPSTVTNQQARDYVRYLNTEAQSARGGVLSYATKHARIAPLRAFWTDYLGHHEFIPHDVNPWKDPKITGRRKANVEDPDRKRPYTDDEILAILRGPELPANEKVRYTKRTLMELYAVAFFTGARIEEICGRTLGDVEMIRGGYLLSIRRAKKDAGLRTIPILHPIPVAILKRRIGKRKDAKAQLWTELIPGGPNGSLAWYVSKALGRYRDKLGLGTAVDTHSTRRTFITRMMGKGLSERLIQFYVGHIPPGVTAGVYAQPTDEGHRKIAREIHYPGKIEQAFRTALGIAAR